jgi:(1->4)-alpha-D-glucan 1-alpha-D-glucosylmutase
LATRREHQELFRDGYYIPVRASGENDDHICAFARKNRRDCILVVVPRFFSGLAPAGQPPIGQNVWHKDSLVIPEDMPRRWQNVFTGESIAASNGTNSLSLAEVLDKFPLALLVGGE